MCFIPGNKFYFTKIYWLILYREAGKSLLSEGFEFIRLTKWMLLLSVASSEVMKRHLDVIYVGWCVAKIKFRFTPGTFSNRGSEFFKIIKTERPASPWNHPRASLHLAPALKGKLKTAVKVLWYYCTHNKSSFSCVSLTHGWLNVAKFSFILFLLLGDLYTFISDG